ncbi:hypothetical protein [Corynebacterium sp.]|uniref:hypothetical protein n=1 Tax=Corynebacterium sp. TaxID=1720 RepID=UPI002A91D0E4|nr:hypothetical protein [Corynebacterium sp.]MDY5786032.1 hypothetical protein [Corynebacterium sp.]
MTEGKQLTVAELLARAGKEPSDAGHSRPRRRRSLEDGGVSVAELTGSMKRVDARPVESKHSSVPIDAPAAPAEPAAPAAAHQEPTEPVESLFTPHVAAVTAEPARDVDNDKTDVLRRVDAPLREPARTGRVEEGALDEFGELRSEDERRDEGGVEKRELVEEDTAAINPILLVLLVFAGLVLGVLGFMAFQWVWANLSTIIAALLALATVAAVIGGVRALKTGRDGLTTALAAVAAAVMAFGPALLV